MHTHGHTTIYAHFFVLTTAHSSLHPINYIISHFFPHISIYNDKSTFSPHVILLKCERKSCSKSLFSIISFHIFFSFSLLFDPISLSLSILHLFIIQLFASLTYSPSISFSFSLSHQNLNPKKPSQANSLLFASLTV